MDSEEDERDFSDNPVYSRVLGMFDGNPSFQRIIRLGLQAELGAAQWVGFEEHDGSKLPIPPSEYLKVANWSSDGRFIGNHTRAPNAIPASYLNALANLNLQAASEKRGEVVPETKKYKGKAERKKLKKQRQKEKKRLEELEKENKSTGKNADRGEHQKSKNETSVKQQACAKDSDSSNCSDEDESSGGDGDAEEDTADFEELDMGSTFVSKAADIARRKLEQNPKPEKKKSPVKEEAKTSQDKVFTEIVTGDKDSVAASNLTVEKSVKISTELANKGNKSASTGNFEAAAKYFTDAIIFNPTEFKLFGNRSFCFEKMQEYEKALADAELSLSLHPGWVKGLFRKGKALAGLKRYEEASQAFSEVLKLEGSYAEAAQELLQMQIMQLMGYGFTREQCSNALIIHGTVQKALEVLSKLTNQPGPVQNGALPPAQVVNISGVSPILSATNPTPPPPPPTTPTIQPQNVPKSQPQGTAVVPAQNMSYVKSQPKPVPDQALRSNSKDQHVQQELFPVWVGNLFQPVSESDILRLFNKVGVVHSVRLLSYRRCAFVNYTKQENCDEAIRRFQGFDLNGAKIAVRYPDRIPHGMGISKSALKADDLEEENIRYEYQNCNRRKQFGPYRHFSQDH